MELVALVILVALIQYIYFSVMVGGARGKYGVDAPATTGNDTFERYYRVQMNTLEMLVSLIPAMVIFAINVRADVAAYAGIVYITGRFIYFKSYVGDPKKRTVGFLLSMLPILVLIVWGGISIIMSMM